MIYTPDMISKVFASWLFLLPFATALTPAFELQDLDHSLLRRQGATSPCILSCYNDIFPQFNCPNITECICYNVPLQTALTKCVLGNECLIADAIAAQKTQKDLCGAPMRDRSMNFTIVETVFFALAVAAAAMRAFGRSPCFGGAAYGWDDIVLFLCCLPMIGLTVTGYLDQASGLGRDIWELPLPQIEKCLMYFYIGNTFYSPVIFGTKIAMVLLYLRVWKDSDPAFRRICQVVIALLLMAMVAFEFSGIFLCSPVQYAWKAVAGLPGHCIARNAQLYSNSGVNIIFDFVVLLLPVPKILSLSMDIGKKIGLLFTFLLGFAVTAASIIQLYYLVTKVSNTQNPTWDFFDIAIWRVTEMYLSIICCCIPIIAGLFKRSWKKATSVVSSSSIREGLDKSWVSSSAGRSKNRSHGGGSIFSGDDIGPAKKSRRGPSEWVELKSNEDRDSKEMAESKELEDGNDPSDGATFGDVIKQPTKRQAVRSGVDTALPRQVDTESSNMRPAPPPTPLGHRDSSHRHPLRSQGKSIPSNESVPKDSGPRIDAFVEPAGERLPGGMTAQRSPSLRTSKPQPLKNLRTNATRLSPTTSPTQEYFPWIPDQQSPYGLVNGAGAHQIPKRRTFNNSSRPLQEPGTPTSWRSNDSQGYKPATPRQLELMHQDKQDWRSSQSDHSAYERRPLPATPEVWIPVKQHEADR